MSDQKCPFCGEPRTRSCATYDVFRCGTEGPDINGEYETGRVCDMHTYQRLLDANAKEIRSLTERLAAAEEAARWWRMAARGYILEEGEVHPDERWPWLEESP